MTLSEIFSKLVGNIVAQGDEAMDTQVSKNIDNTQFIEEIIKDLCSNSVKINSKQASINHIATKSYHELLILKEMIDDAVKESKQKLFKDSYSAPKIKQLEVPPRVFKIIPESTYLLSPFNIEYNIEWYNNETGENYTLDDIKEVVLFKTSVSESGVTRTRAYNDSDKEIRYWDHASPEEIKYLGTNIMVQPETSEIGTIKNFYGDIYTLKTFYDAVEKYNGIEEPLVLASKEFL